jgi:hypothetical protein
MSNLYSSDANYYNKVSREIEDEAEQLLLAAKDISAAITNVGVAASEGANDAVSIANKINVLCDKSQDIENSSRECEDVSIQLNEAVKQLKIS